MFIFVWMQVADISENLEYQLSLTATEQAKANLLLEAFENGLPFNTKLYQYIPQLQQLVIGLPPAYNGWALLYTIVLNRRNSNYKKLMDFAQQALEIFTSCHDTKGIGAAFNEIATIHEDEGRYQHALDYNFKALSIWQKLQNKIREADTLNNIGTTYQSWSRYTDAMAYHQQALEIRKKINDQHGIARSYNNMANVHLFQDNYTQAQVLFTQCLQILLALGDKKNIATCQNNLGIIYYQLGNYTKSLQCHLQALQLREEIDDKQGKAYSYNNVAIIQYAQQNFAEALKNNVLSLQILEEIGDKFGISDAYNNIANTYQQLNNYPEALNYYLRTLAMKQEIGDQKGIANAYNSLGEICEIEEKYTEALEYHFKALAISNEVGEKRGMAGYYKSIGRVYQKQGNYEAAIKNMKIALDIAEQITNKQAQKECCEVLFTTYKAIGDFKNALHYHERLHALERDLLGEKTQEQLTALNFEHNLEQKEHQLEIEQLRNVELKQERDRSEKLLLNILPTEVAEELKQTGKADARLYNNVTVLYTDFVGFTRVSERLTPQQLVNELHSCFSAFDEIMLRHNIEKIKTVGDAYLAVSGLPLPDEKNAINIINAAIEVQQFMLQRYQQLGPATFEIRIGINSGSVVAGIVGINKYAYDIWGDTVNTAARMEQNSMPGKINISHNTYLLVQHSYKCTYRGEIEAKNKGLLKMYFVNTD